MRRVVVLLAAAGVLLGLAGYVLIAGRAEPVAREQASAAPGPERLAPGRLPLPSPDPRPGPVPAAGAAAPSETHDPGLPVPPGAGALDGPITDAALQRLLDEGSDLPLEQRRFAVTLAAVVLGADLTGRDIARVAAAWPQLWPAGPPRVFGYRDWQLHAGTARRSPGGVAAVLVYSATGVDGARVDHAQATVELRAGPEGWRPVAIR